MSHNLSHTIFRSDSYYYNRRVPERVRDAFGMSAVRVKLGIGSLRPCSLEPQNFSQKT